MKVQRWLSFFILCISVIICELLCPYTKVEESFGMQAMHDFLFCQTTACGDHITFPGVVPRTFLGVWFITVVTLLPFAFLFIPVITSIPLLVLNLGVNENMNENMGNLLSLETLLINNPMILSHACRIVLGIFFCCSLWHVATGIDKFNSNNNYIVEKQSKTSLPNSKSSNSSIKNKKCFSSTIFFLLCITQFHLIFYATRLLPNTYGLILSTFACGCILRQQYYYSIALLSSAAALFRCDILVLLAPLSLFLLFKSNIKLLPGVLTGISAVLLSLWVSVGLDSFLWGKWIWPESFVLFFNTAENQSWRWGQEPIYWYFIKALPRAFLFLYPFLLFQIGVAWCGMRNNINSSNIDDNNNNNNNINSPLSYFHNLLSLKCGRVFELWYHVSLRYRVLLIPGSLFIALYSLLPHKEMRFIILVFPWFLVPLSSAISETLNEFFLSSSSSSSSSSSNILVKNKIKQIPETKKLNKKSKNKTFTIIFLIILYILQISTVGVSVFISIFNYPGAFALEKLHSIIEEDINNTSSCINKLNLVNTYNKNNYVTVFIDDYAAMTGINRFQKKRFLKIQQEIRDEIIYHNNNNNIIIIIIFNLLSGIQHRLISLLALPFISWFRILEEKNPKTHRWREYDFSDTFGVSPSIVGDNYETDISSQLSTSSSNNNNNIIKRMQIRYTKNPELFNEKNGTYHSDELDYLLVRYSQREMHRSHGKFEEIFAINIPNWKLLTQHWLNYILSGNRSQSFNNNNNNNEGEPFLLALRRRCQE